MRLMARRCSTINSSIRYCALRPAPQLPTYRQAVGLSEELPKNRRRTEVPVSFSGSAGAVGRHNKTPNRAAVRAGAVSICRFRTSARCFRCASLLSKGKAMQVPSILQGVSLKRLMQGAAAGAVATMVIGFNWGGWSLGSTADKMAKERSELAVIAALAPVCADKFRALPDADAKKVALSKVDSWKRRDEFPKELVTLPGESYPSSALVDACYTLLFAPKSAALN